MDSDGEDSSDSLWGTYTFVYVGIDTDFIWTRLTAKTSILSLVTVGQTELVLAPSTAEASKSHLAHGSRRPKGSTREESKIRLTSITAKNEIGRDNCVTCKSGNSYLRRWPISDKFVKIKWSHTLRKRLSRPGAIDRFVIDMRGGGLKSLLKMVGKKDKFCWKCHKQEKEVLSCELCPRSYHLKCVLLRERPQEAWVCPECVLVTHADDEASRFTSDSSKRILHGLLRIVENWSLFVYADNFYDHVNTTEFPDYLQFIVKPMCISTLEKMVDNREIASTQGLLAETKWIHHNCVVYNGLSPRPHVPVWARMTGFPFWPAKAMGIKDGGVQVFFFADHNRAVVQPSEVFLYSQDIPFPNQRISRKQRLEDAVEEMKQYLYQLMKKDYKLKLAPCQTRYDPNRDEEHRQMMLPNYVEWVPQKRPRTCVPLNLSYSILITPPSGVPWDLSNLVEVGLNPQWKPGQVHTRDRRLVRAKTKRGTGSCQLATSWKIKAEKLPMHLKDRTNEDASTLMGNSMVHLNLESTHLDSSSSIDKSLMIAASKAKKKKLLQISKSPSSLGSDMKRRRKTVSPKPNSKDNVIPEGASKPGLLVPSKEACPDSSAHKVLENSDKAFINGSFSIPKETSIDSGKKSPNVMLKGGVTSELSSEVKTAPTASSSVDKEDITVHLKTTNNIKTSEKSDSGCRTAANDGDSNSMELIEIKKELIDECEMDGDILSPPSKDTALMVYSPMLEPKISLTVLNEQVHTDSPTTSSLMTERLLSMDPISKEISFALSPEVNLFLQPSTKISKHNNEVSSDSLGQQHLQIGSPPASPQLAIKKLSDKKMNQPGSSGAETANDTRVQLPPNGTDSQPLPNHANDPKLFPSLKIPLNSPSLLPNLLMNYYPAIANPKTPEDVKAGTMLNSLSYEVSSILIGLEAFQNKTRLPNGIPKKSKLHEYKDSILELLLRLVLYDNERNMNLQTSETVFYNYLYNTNLNPLTDQYCHTDRDKTKCSSLCKIIDEDIKSLSKECQRQVEDAKKKLWCSFCSKEAFLHCCLKAAYCSRHCQASKIIVTLLELLYNFRMKYKVFWDDTNTKYENLIVAQLRLPRIRRIPHRLDDVSNRDVLTFTIPKEFYHQLSETPRPAERTTCFTRALLSAAEPLAKKKTSSYNCDRAAGGSITITTGQNRAISNAASFIREGKKNEGVRFYDGVTPRVVTPRDHAVDSRVASSLGHILNLYLGPWHPESHGSDSMLQIVLHRGGHDSGRKQFLVVVASHFGRWLRRWRWLSRILISGSRYSKLAKTNVGQWQVCCDGRRGRGLSHQSAALSSNRWALWRGVSAVNSPAENSHIGRYMGDAKTKQIEETYCIRLSTGPAGNNGSKPPDELSLTWENKTLRARND
uniref:Protein kinase C-binding protein 1 n=1 Tax=Timema cristinae TaxID=61476 RepID=A0A7R9CD38_TIMCR|nr:unnamed protein product [Timema cristinae]